MSDDGRRATPRLATARPATEPAAPATRRALLAAAALSLGGCAAWFPPPQTAALRSATDRRWPRRLERDAVPFFPQTPLHCGPAALATALADIGLPADPERLAEGLFIPARGGSLQVEMLGAARRAGALAVPVPGTLAALLDELSAGHAVVVLQNLGLAIAPRWHYAVIVGHDLDERWFVLRSGTERRQLMSLATFEHTWARGGHWAVVLVRPGRLPATATEDASVEAALGFERVAAPATAAEAWRGVLARWPASLLGRLGLGNGLAGAGDLDGAAAAFDQAAREHDSAVAWNNLARVELQRGRWPAADAAAAQALRRAADSEPGWREAAAATAALVAAARPSAATR